MRNHLTKRRRSVGIALTLSLGLLTLWTAGGALPATARQQAARPAIGRGQFGPFSLDYRNGTIEYTLGSGKSPQTTVTLQGPRVSITSARYDISAPHIQLIGRPGGLVKGTASGRVHVVARDQETGQVTTVDCDSARYAVGATPKTGRIDLEGNVVSKTTAPQLAQPLESESKSGFIEFQPDGRIRVVLAGGTMTVTPNEPAPRAKGSAQ